MENEDLKDHILYLDNLYQKEQAKNKEILPRYRESVEQLKKRVCFLKDNFIETQQLLKEDKDVYSENVSSHFHFGIYYWKMKELEQVKKTLLGEVIKFKDINKELKAEIKSYEHIIKQSEVSFFLLSRNKRRRKNPKSL